MYDDVKTFYQGECCISATSVMLCTSIFALFFAAVQGETFLFGTSGVLPCVANTDDSDQYTWTDTTGGSVVQLYRVDVNGVVESTNVNTNPKYQNFVVDNDFPKSVNISINPVTLQHVGIYQCTVFNIPEFAKILTLDVEVKPQQIMISCQSSMECPSKDSSISSEVTCVCNAIGAFPESLELNWINATDTSTEKTDSSSGLSGTFDFTSSTTLVVDKDNSMVSCKLTGYTSEVDESEVLSTYHFSPPSCLLNIDCSEEVIVCNCENASPTGIMYTFYDKDQKILEGSPSTSNQMRVDIIPGEDNTFYCWGCNGIYYGENSFVNNTVSCPTQPTGSTTTTEKDNGTGTGKGDKGLSAVIIVVIIVVVIAILIIVGGFTFWMVSKRGCCEKCTEEKNAVTATTGDTSSAPVYGVIDKSKKKKSDKTDGNGMQMSEAPEYAAVSKPLNSEPKPAPRSSQPPPTNSTEKQELQYADIDHSNRTPSNQIRQPAEAPTEYATVQSVIV